MSDQNQSKKNAMFVLIACCVMMFCANGIILGTAGSFIVPVAKSFGVPLSTVSLYLTVQGLFMMFFVPVMGRFMAKGNPRVVATLCMAVMALGFLLFSFWTAPWGFYISGALIGLGAACICYVAVPLFINSWFSTNVGTYLGIAVIFPGIGQLIFNPICTNLIASIGWRSTYLIAGGFTAVLGVLILALFLRNNPNTYGLTAYGAGGAAGQTAPVISGMTPGEVYRSSVFIPLLIGAFIFGYCVSVVSTVVTFVMTAEALPVAQAGLAGTAIAVGMMIGKFVMGKLYDKFKIGPVTLAFSILQCIGFVMCVMVYANKALLFPAMIVVGIGIGGTGTITMPMVSRALFGPKHFAGFYPKFTIALSAASALSGFVNNFIYDKTGTYASIFYIMAAASIVGALIIQFSQSKQNDLHKQWETPSITGK